MNTSSRLATDLIQQTLVPGSSTIQEQHNQATSYHLATCCGCGLQQMRARLIQGSQLKSKITVYQVSRNSENMYLVQLPSSRGVIRGVRVWHTLEDLLSSSFNLNRLTAILFVVVGFIFWLFKQNGRIASLWCSDAPFFYLSSKLWLEELSSTTTHDNSTTFLPIPWTDEALFSLLGCYLCQ